MLILKIKEVFLPSAISENGIVYDNMQALYIGFRTEVIQELAWDEQPVIDSQFIGMEYIIIEKVTRGSADFYKGDTVCVSTQYLTHSKVLVNNANEPVMRPCPFLVDPD